MNIEFDNIFDFNNDNNKQIDLDVSTVINSDHNKLINRGMKNQHPINAITSLTEE